MSTIAPGATVLVRQDGPAARVTLNRPDKRNALSLELMQELIAALRRSSGDPATRAIVVEAAGPAFSAGHDLSEMIGRDVPFFQRLFDVCTELMETIHRLVPEDALDAEIDALVEAIARSSPLTVGIGKEAFYSQIELDEHRAYDLTKAVMAMNARADDAQEGMCAFLEKRPPEWRGT